MAPSSFIDDVTQRCDTYGSEARLSEANEKTLKEKS
jgi:hypothetical protein